MQLYRYHVKPLSAFATPLRSDTLYGHLLWAAAMLFGDARVKELIGAFAGEAPPFLVSSALPSGQLPLPPLPGIPRRRFKDKYTGDSGLVDKLKLYKAFRKLSFWSLDQWQQQQGRLAQETLFDQWLFAQSFEKQSIEKGALSPLRDSEKASQPHVIIDRQSGSVLNEGGLFFSSSTWYRPGLTLDLYVKTPDIALFEKLFRHLEATGFGADRSTGKGHFSWERDDDFNPTIFDISGSHRLSLSVCASEETQNFSGYWSPFIKHGRAWSGFGERNPFKKPFFAFAEGSLFSAMPKNGYLLRNIHSNPDVVQVGWPLTIPVTLEGYHAD